MEIKGKVHYVGVNDRSKALFRKSLAAALWCVL